MVMYVYINPKPGLYTVGFYTPAGKWIPESDWKSAGEAAERVAWLNGSKTTLPRNIIEALNSGDGVYRP